MRAQAHRVGLNSPLQRLYGCVLLLAFLLGGVCNLNAQTSGPLDGSIPLAMTPGAPAGSYALSGFENINLYNGNLNFHLPLMPVGERGDARYTITLPVEQHWFSEYWADNEAGAYGYYVHDRLPPFYPKAGYGPGNMRGQSVATAETGCTYPGNRYAYTLTRLTFAAPDGTIYQFRDQLTNGRRNELACGSANLSRGKIFVTSDGSSMTFVSDLPIVDQSYASVAELAPTGYLMFRDGTSYRVQGGAVTEIRDRNGNKLTFDYGPPNPELGSAPNVSEITDQLNRKITICYASTQTCPNAAPYDQITYTGFGGATRTIRIRYDSLSNLLRPGSGYTTKGVARLQAVLALSRSGNILLLALRRIRNI